VRHSLPPSSVRSYSIDAKFKSKMQNPVLHRSGGAKNGVATFTTRSAENSRFAILSCILNCRRQNALP